jgi:hypothetical protein
MHFVIVVLVSLFHVNLFGNTPHVFFEEVPASSLEVAKAETNFNLYPKKHQLETNRAQLSLNKYQAETFITRNICIYVFGFPLFISYAQEENVN